ncbi:MAG: sorting protein [Rhizorhabdus sp.]|nr:sorting protein [Rhizorhabdus sp.]
MKSVKWAIVATLAALGAMSPVMGAVIIDSEKTDFTFNIDYLGQVKGEEAKEIGALGSFTFTGLSEDKLTYNFNYSITNDSKAESRLRSFGFNEVSSAGIAKATSTGAYAYADLDVNYPEKAGRMDICFASTENGSCTGGKDGLNSGETGKGTFALTLEKAVSSLALDDFIVRFQSIDPKINGGDSGVGFGSVVGSDVGSGDVVSPAPEPVTWAMMILGFGLIGATMRQRRDLRMPAMIAAR